MLENKVQSRGEKLWLCMVAVGIGLSLLVSGCGSSDKKGANPNPEEPMFFSIVLAQEELKGRVKRAKIVVKTNREEEIVTEIFFSPNGIPEKTSVLEPSKTNIHFYDEKGRMVRQIFSDAESNAELVTKFDDMNNKYLKAINGWIVEEGNLDPQTKEILRRTTGDIVVEHVLDSSGSEIGEVVFENGKRREESETKYNEWGQIISTKKIVYDTEFAPDKVKYMWELTDTYKDGFKISSLVNSKDYSPLVPKLEKTYENENFDNHGNWRKRQERDDSGGYGDTITREIEYYQ